MTRLLATALKAEQLFLRTQSAVAERMMCARLELGCMVENCDSGEQAQKLVENAGIKVVNPGLCWPQVDEMLVVVDLFSDGDILFILEDKPGLDQAITAFVAADDDYADHPDTVEYHGGFKDFMAGRGYPTIPYRMKRL